MRGIPLPEFFLCRCVHSRHSASPRWRTVNAYMRALLTVNNTLIRAALFCAAPSVRTLGAPALPASLRLRVAYAPVAVAICKRGALAVGDVLALTLYIASGRARDISGMNYSKHCWRTRKGVAGVASLIFSSSSTPDATTVATLPHHTTCPRPPPC